VRFQRQQFQVSVSPFDVKLSGFAGEQLVLLLVPNNFEGSTYFSTEIKH
jgi:hypothetical protein